jgi:hypothetical protein
MSDQRHLGDDLEPIAAQDTKHGSEFPIALPQLERHRRRRLLTAENATSGQPSEYPL